MKNLELWQRACYQGVCLENFQIATFNESPKEDCANLFGDITDGIFPSSGTYLYQMTDLVEPSAFGEPDAMLILENPADNGIVYMWRIDD